MRDIHVIKLGGSLLDMPDLVARFETFRAAYVTGPALLVTGGAESADLVRFFDKQFHIGEEQGHWLAVRAMQFNAYVVAAVLPRCRIVCDEVQAGAGWEAGELAVIDPLIWLQREESRGVCVPHRWSFTSDSIAGHVATRLGAKRLTLLKSTLPAGIDTASRLPCDRTVHGPHPSPLPGGEGAGAAALAGIVDADFLSASATVAAIDVINLRHSLSPAEPQARWILR